MSIETNNINVPKRFDVNFFTLILRNHLRQPKVTIKSISFSMGSNPGDNYCSEIYRAAIKYSIGEKSSERLSLIIKCLRSDELISMIDVCHKEVKMCSEMIPLIEGIVNVKIGPKFVHSINEQPRIIVLEDLKPAGYVIGNRHQGYDFNVAKIVLQKLAKFHAGSMILYKKYPKIMDTLREGFFSPQWMDKMHLIPNNFTFMAKTVNDWEGYEDIAKKLNKMAENIRSKCIQSVAETENGLKVLNHGDFWVNNIMLKYNPDNPTIPEDALFIDYQLGFYSSPGIDINYFFSTSLRLDILMYKRDELISIYYKSLKGMLQELKYDQIPTEADIKKEIHERELYGLIMVAGIFPFIIRDPEIVKDFDITRKDLQEVNMKLLYSSQRLVNTLKYSLRRFDELKVLDQ